MNWVYPKVKKDYSRTRLMLYTNLLDNVPTTFYANHVMNVSKRIIIIFTNISVMMKPKTISSRFLSLQKTCLLLHLIII